MTDVFELDNVSVFQAPRRPLLNRDMDLVRRILLHVEKKQTLQPEPVMFDDIDHEVLGRHVEMLHKENLLDGQLVGLSHLSYVRVNVTDLTWDGHDFVAALK